MEITGTNRSGIEVPTVESDEVGFAGLDADAFMRLLIATLQNQDPLEPVGNDDLLNQLATMRNLQANIELGEALEAITINQQLSTAATYIGRSITGTGTNQQFVTGIADRAFLRDGQAFVGIGDEELALSNVTSINQAPGD